jgi:peroxiredoxin
VRGFMRNYPIDFPVLLDRNGRVANRWQVRGMPTTFVLNGKGEIVYRVVGKREWDSESVVRQIRALKPASMVQGDN